MFKTKLKVMYELVDCEICTSGYIADKLQIRQQIAHKVLMELCNNRMVLKTVMQPNIIGFKVNPDYLKHLITQDNKHCIMGF